MASSPPAASRRLEAGARIGGKYRLARRIAVGGMGEVWRARNEMTGADVAVKISRRRHGDDLDVRFRTEAKLGSTVSHRNIVRIFDLVEDEDGSLVLVMELLRGESLAQRLKTLGRLSTKEAIAIVAPILSGLAHAHAEGIVHRDVTPANVFLAVDPDGQITPKLIDFGIAKLPAAGAQTLDGRVLGTPRYMAPEQIRAQPIDGRADLFSVAVVLYEALTGVCPFDAPLPSASLAAVLECEVDPDPHIEPRVWIELRRALSKRPYERHAEAAALADALRLAVGETEASLAALLRRAPPTREEIDRAEDGAPISTATIEGQSVDERAARKRPAWAAWGVAAIVAACTAGLATSLLRAPHVDASPSPAATSAAPTPPPVVSASLPPAPPSATADAPQVPAIVVAPAVTPATKSSPRTVSHPKRPKPIATTPGY